MSPARAFVERHTHREPVPLVPGLTLRTVDNVIGLWESTGAQEPPFWAFPWAGGQALARYVLDHPELVYGRRVLDLACGGGLVAIAAARAGGHVTAVDIDPLALAATEVNAADNDVQVAVRAVDLLDGRHPAVDMTETVDVTEAVDVAEVVLAGDVFYERDFAGRAFTFLAAAAARGADVLAGDPQRAYLPDHGLELVTSYDVTVTEDLEGVTLRRTGVYRVLPRGRCQRS